MQTALRYLIAILVSVVIMTLDDFFENKLGIKTITFMGISVLVWAFVFHHVSNVAKERHT